MTKDTGGPAFPVSIPGWGDNGASGMTLLDWYAGQATEDDIKQFIPETVGGVADLLVSLGLISAQARNRNVITCYSREQRIQLRYWARYKHAAAMIAERNKPFTALNNGVTA